MPSVIAAHGRRYLIENPGGIMGRCIADGSPYERKVLERIYRKNLTGIAVDAGASIGNHSLWLAAICGLKVIAVEPLDPYRLQSNISLNPELDITVWPFALGDETGQTTVTVPPAHVVGERFPEDGIVRVARLDEFSLQGVSLIKIDVDGMEPQVLRGAEETIRRDKPVIYAEAQDEAAAAANLEVLRPLGYRHVKTFGATPLQEWLP